MIRFLRMPSPSRISGEPRFPRLPAASLVALLLSASCGGGGAARRSADQAMTLYDQGAYALALPKLKEAVERGERNGSVLYQLGFCRSQVEHDEAGKKQAWAEARPLLEKEVAAPGGATLERLYYLMRIAAEEQANDKMTQYARQGVEQFEKGPNPNGLGGADWFRLGRLHEFLREPSPAEAAYRLAVSTFGKSAQGGGVYHALALARVGDFDYDAGRYKDAAGHYDAALKLFPGTDQVDPYRHGIVLLDAGLFDEAAARFKQVQEGATVTEAQYGADLARKAKEVAPIEGKDADGVPFSGMTEDDLQGRIRSAVKALRAARVKNSMKPGDLLPAEVADRQRRFIGLLREQMVRTKLIQDFCLGEGIADLVRR